MRRPYLNTTDKAVFVGGKLVPPGESREIDVPDAPAAEPQAAAAGDGELLAKLLEGTIAAIAPQLAGLTDEQLVELERLEGQGKKRAGVGNAIAAVQMDRADAVLLTQRQDALALAELDLQQAQAALAALPADAPEATRLDAQAAVEAAQAKANGARAALEG